MTKQNIHSATITPIDAGFTHTVHSYQGLCPWDHAGKRLLFLGFETGKPGAVIVRDLEKGTDRIVGHSDQYDYHCAAWQQWALGDSAVVYRSGVGPEDQFCITDVAANATRICTPGALTEVRHITADGKRAYAVVSDSKSAAVCRLDLAGGQTEKIITLEQAEAATQPEFHDPHHHYRFSHPVANATESALFVKFEKLTRPWPTHPNGNENWGSFLIVNLQTGEIRSLGNRISGHPQWMPDGKRILNIKKPLDGSDNRWLVYVDTQSGQDTRVVDQPIEGAGHPVVSPDGKWIATDAYTADGAQCPIYLIHSDTGVVHEIARLCHRVKAQSGYDPTTILRANPHPVWSPEGNKLLVNCNHDGQRMQLLMLSDFLA